MLVHKIKVASAAFAAVCLLGLAAGALAIRGHPAEAAGRQLAAESKPGSVDNEDLVKIPALRDGVVSFIGTPVKPGEKVPASLTATVKIGSERIIYRLLRKGDHVEADQLLAQLNDRLSRNDLAISQAKITVGQSDAEAAEATAQEALIRLDRQRKLLRTASTSTEDVEAAKLTWVRFKAQAIARRADIDIARLWVRKAEMDLELYQVRSPVRGVIKSIKKHAGEAVKQFDTVFEVEPSSGR
jgi:multidrug efflux pump subunit AcrA (membrane-fusion protein)